LCSGEEHNEDHQFLEGVGGNGVADLLTDERPGHDWELSGKLGDDGVR
jgi:hypothetical protein